MSGQGIQPIFILPEDAKRSTGREAQKTNIEAAKAVANTVKSTLGPKGMDKMLVDATGDIVITNDGVTILEEMQIEHPAAKMMVEVAKTQEDEVGDGTTSSVILAGELLKNAEELIETGIHPTVIAEGYKIASDKSQEFLNKIAKGITIDDKEELYNIAKTAMTGKHVEWAKETLGKIAVDAILQINENNEIDSGNIKIEKKQGGSIHDSSLVQGLVIDKERVHSNMPKKIENAKILLLDTPLEVKETEIDTKVQIDDPDKLQLFLDREEKAIKGMVEKIIKSKANVVFCQKGIDDLAQHFLSKKGIFALRRVTQSDMKKLARATDAKILSNIDEIDEKDLGSAGIVHEKKLGNENMTFIEKCENPKAVSIIIRGGTEHVVDEVERAVKDAIGDLAATLSDGKFVVGGGAIEIELAKELNDYAQTLSGRKQLAVQKFAKAIEIIPKCLAENAGLDPIDKLTELKAQHEEGKITAGLNVLNGKVENLFKQGVIEPLKIKTQAIKSSSEAALMILRIDDVISAGKLDKGSSGGMPPMPPGGLPY